MRRIFWPKSPEQVISKYTKDLKSITTRIHDLNVRLKQNDASLASCKQSTVYYGVWALFIGALTIYVKYAIMGYVILFLIFGGSFILFVSQLLNKLFDYHHRRIVIQLDQARALHQEKLDGLKKETNFYSTTSLIQRFSSGEEQSEDVVTLLDEELEAKQKELKKLKGQLEELKNDAGVISKKASKEETDKWFDKVLDVLSGGDDFGGSSQLMPVKCHKCSIHNGCYVIKNKPWEYICPKCGCRNEYRPSTANNLVSPPTEGDQDHQKAPLTANEKAKDDTKK